MSSGFSFQCFPPWEFPIVVNIIIVPICLFNLCESSDFLTETVKIF